MFSWKYTGREVAAPGYIKEKTVSLLKHHQSSKRDEEITEGGE